MKRIFLSLMMASMMVSGAFAGEAKVNWHEPEKYTDIRPSNETRDGFQARVFKDFDQIFSDLAKKLPDGYLLEITVTDLDLAGDVDPMYFRKGQEIRVIKELYWPKMTLTYTLKNPQGEAVSAGKEELKDMNFMSRVGLPSVNTGFPYEERMLLDWFRKQQKNKIFPTK